MDDNFCHCSWAFSSSSSVAVCNLPASRTVLFTYAGISPHTHLSLFLLYTLILDSPPTPPPPACWLFFFSCLPLSDRYYSSSASSASPPCWPCACICLWCGFVFVMERIIKNEIMFKYANVPSLSLSLFLPSAPSPFISLSPSLYLALSFGA